MIYREDEDVLLLDSGSPTFPHHKRIRLGSVALLEITKDSVRAELVSVGETPGSPNPITPASVVYERGRILEATLDGEPVEQMNWRPATAPRLYV